MSDATATNSTLLAQNLDFKINKPLVILVDGNSASASEILSGALKDYKKAVLLGTKTYGKGMVQKIIPLQNDTGLNLTIAKYLTPKGNDINKKGIEPDYKVEFTINDLKNQNDVQLAAAKNILNLPEDYRKYLEFLPLTGNLFPLCIK